MCFTRNFVLNRCDDVAPILMVHMGEPLNDTINEPIKISIS